MTAPAEFYTERIPRQFNHALELQERHAAEEGDGSDAARILAGLKGVDATIRAIVSSAPSRSPLWKSASARVSR